MRINPYRLGDRVAPVGGALAAFAFGFFAGAAAFGFFAGFGFAFAALAFRGAVLAPVASRAAPFVRAISGSGSSRSAGRAVSAAA